MDWWALGAKGPRGAGIQFADRQGLTIAREVLVAPKTLYLICAFWSLQLLFSTSVQAQEVYCLDLRGPTQSPHSALCEVYPVDEEVWASGASQSVLRMLETTADVVDRLVGYSDLQPILVYQDPYSSRLSRGFLVRGAPGALDLWELKRQLESAGIALGGDPLVVPVFADLDWLEPDFTVSLALKVGRQAQLKGHFQLGSDEDSLGDFDLLGGGISLVVPLR